MSPGGNVTRDDLDRLERALLDRLAQRDAVVDSWIAELKANLPHKVANVRQEFLGRVEILEDEVRLLGSGDDGVPVLRARIRQLEQERRDDERRIDELRMSAARFAGLVAAIAPAAGLVAWLLDRLIGS